MEVKEYISDVLEGKRICGDLELAAVKRWAKFESNPDIYYDEDGVNRIISIFRMLRHTIRRILRKTISIITVANFCN